MSTKERLNVTDADDDLSALARKLDIKFRPGDETVVAWLQDLSEDDVQGLLASDDPAGRHKFLDANGWEQADTPWVVPNVWGDGLSSDELIEDGLHIARGAGYAALGGLGDSLYNSGNGAQHSISNVEEMLQANGSDLAAQAVALGKLLK